ncbi:expressed unknown protein [Seminavis robusta]|uniref:Uncharacterized protein n=1 Tax=Seminavis robusta TaxID=568900 RepID=A0A9N8HUM7_9STRA|nr:expressed unknown protein [Seminavis robusta]|eukprot:Sro2118_g315310.1 n/a (407) ;mRNA; f:3034-4254
MGDQFLSQGTAPDGSGTAAAPAEAVQEEQLPIYAGKWTQEEEQYAQFLMEEFRAGNIPGLENGASMRNYLAKMLICRPKRVTKKYERTGYNGKLTYQGNLIKLSPQQAQERHQKLAVLRAKFLESRKQRLCLVLPGSLKPPPPSPSPSMTHAASLTAAGLGHRSSFTALDNQGSLLGQNSLAFGLTGGTGGAAQGGILGGMGGLGGLGNPFLSHAAERNALTSRLLASSMGAGMAPAPALHPAPSGLGGLSDQLLLRSSMFSGGGAQNPLPSSLHQRGPLLNSAAALPRGSITSTSSGTNPFLAGGDPLAQQHVLAQLQMENEQRANELMTRRHLMAEIHREEERKASLERVLLEQYHRTGELGDPSGAEGSEPGDRERRAGLKRTGADPPDDGPSQQDWKRHRGL